MADCWNLFVMNEKLDAICFPIVSRATALGFIVLCAILLGTAILFLPAYEQRMPSWIIPNALALASNSRFPYALGVGYSMALYASLCCGFFSIFIRGSLISAGEMRRKQSVTSRVLCDLLFILLIYLLFTQELSFSPRPSSIGFFSAVAQNRLVALFWVEGVFGFIYVATLMILFDITILMRKILCK